jgi:hypothetical protein
MANLFFATADGLKAYRLQWTLNGDPANNSANAVIDGCHVTGADVLLPDGGRHLNALDVPCDVKNLLIDWLADVVDKSTKAAYVTLYKAVTDSTF